MSINSLSISWQSALFWTWIIYCSDSTVKECPITSEALTWQWGLILIGHGSGKPDGHFQKCPFRVGFESSWFGWHMKTGSVFFLAEDQSVLKSIPVVSCRAPVFILYLHMWLMICWCICSLVPFLCKPYKWLILNWNFLLSLSVMSQMISVQALSR